MNAPRTLGGRRARGIYLGLGLVASCGIASQAQATPFFQVAGAGTAPNTNNYPTNENPGNTRDSDPGTKYLNFGITNTGLVETPGTSTVTGIIFATANDSPNRDPLTFSLYGSNTVTITGTETAGSYIDLANFTPIALNQVITGFATDPGRSTTVANQAITNSLPYNTYAIIFPTIRDATTANSMQVGDVILTGASGNITTSTTPIDGGQQQATPEPGSIALLGVGALGLLARRRNA